MTSSLSNLVNNLSEGILIHKNGKKKYETYETCEIRTKYATVLLNTQILKMI